MTKLSQFRIKIPNELVALHPVQHRDEARLLVVHKDSGNIEHRVFKDVVDYFSDGDVFVFNDTKVFPARLCGNKEKTNAFIQVFLLRELNPDLRLWDVLVDPARKIRIGNKLYFGEDNSMVAEVIDNTTSRGRTLRFLYDGDHENFKRDLYDLGKTPLPDDFIKLRDIQPEDAENYQTIYAKKEGAVVAPASGLHFSRELMLRLQIKGIVPSYLTLHCGLCNCADIDVEDLTKYKMDSEQMFVSEELVKTVNTAKNDGSKVCAVGTSVMRALETAVCTNGMLKPYDGWTNKFIFPPYDFSVATSMIANFYSSESQLLMMTAAFGGYENIMNAYHEAIKEKYRFGIYGDAILII
ncbi:MAG: tRNA preQ1(34) S-adenosylmethionine ribosyltransferase-isomerase QueA [Paludibacteraceae bacterium]|nr:tRNA preQ1(34) S-adenosylmethionine ribosyltransferase-isomerase QueA [Paludibacteraceae bacterium]